MDKSRTVTAVSVTLSDVNWTATARRQGGVITRVQLFGTGLGEGAVDKLVTRRDLREVLPTIYVHSSAPVSAQQRLWTAALWTGGVISHRSAAALHDIPVMHTTTVHVIVGDRRSLGIRLG
ncbi:hypothetical protein ACSMXN_21450 [Jatrophihabitans sp. DSM 45814]